MNSIFHPWSFKPTTAREIIAQIFDARGVRISHPYDARFLGSQTFIDWNIETFSSERYIFLQHEHYKSVYDTHRRLPVVSYANVDFKLGGADDNRNFQFDPLVAERLQFGPSFYADDDFDRGHLTRRRSVAWGLSDDEISEAQNQSDYYTNIVPQYSRFNRVTWLAVEAACLALASQNGRSIEVTGVWFDAKLSREEAIYDRHPNSAVAKRRVPDAFWKCCIVANKAVCYFVPHTKVETLDPAKFELSVEELSTKLGYPIGKNWKFARSN